MRKNFLVKTLLIAFSAGMIAASAGVASVKAEEDTVIENSINDGEAEIAQDDYSADTSAETESTAPEANDNSETAENVGNIEETKANDTESDNTDDNNDSESAFDNAAETVSKDEEKNDQSGKEENTIQDEVANVTLDVLKNTFDALKEKVPGVAIFGDPIKNLVGKAFGIDTSDPVISKLDSIQKSIDQAASDIKSTTKDTVVLGNYGTILNKLDSIANTVNDDIKDIQKRTNLTEEQKSQEIAKLYTSRSELRTQIDLAAKVFNGDTMDEPSGRSLYKVLYDNIAANPNVYTSGDAIDKSTPYLTKAMGQFVKANAVLDELMTQYEKVNGANSLKATRGKMDDRFIGSVDKSGKVTGKGMLQKYEEFFKQDRHKEIRSCGGGATGQW